MAFPENKTNAVDNVTMIVASLLNNLEDKVGIDLDPNPNSLDYMVRNLAAENDPVFVSSDAYGITVGDISDWNTAFGWGDHAGLYSSVGHGHSGVYEPIGAVATHEALATGIHGVGASTVESATGSQAKVDSHKDLSTGVHGAGASTLETIAGSQGKVDTHAALATGIHGVGGGTVAKVSDIAGTKLDDFTAPDDNTDLDASISKHGLMPKADKVKLDGVESGATKYPDTGEQAFLDADHTKLDGIESGATKYPDTGEQAFLDADHTKLDGIEVGATKYPDIGEEAYSSTEKTKLTGIEASADVTDAVNVGSSIHGVADKNPPIDADKVPLIDTAASNVLKTSTWTNIKAFLKTYFDTLYRGVTADHTHQSAGAQAGKLDHGLALDGLNDDDHTQYIKHSLATAASDFLAASGAGAFVKKTLAETQAILGFTRTNWTPTVTSGSGTPTTVNTLGIYAQIGKLVLLYFKISIVDKGTASDYMRITNLPVTADQATIGQLPGFVREGGVTGKLCQFFVHPDGTGGQLQDYTGANNLWVNGYILYGNSFYWTA